MVDTLYTHVATLVRTPPLFPLAVSQLERARNILQHRCATVADYDWLEAGVAADILFTTTTAPADALALEHELPGVDIIIQPLATRRKQLFLADMDSTMIGQECLDELAAAIGLKAEIAAITERAMRGELDFVQALTERVQHLRGLPESALDQARARLTFTAGAHTLIRTLKAHGVQCYLVSGGFRYFTRFVAQELGFAGEYGNDLEVKDGLLTGRVLSPILDKSSKLKILHDLGSRLTIPLTASMAIGDGANDIPMLQASGLGFAFRAKPVVEAAAHARLRQSDLTAVLYALGLKPLTA